MRLRALLPLSVALVAQAVGQQPIRISVQADKTVTPVSPALYGVFFEEINQAGDGGIYAELLRNRGFEGANGGMPAGWKANESATFDATVGLNPARPGSIFLKPVRDGHAGVVNEGFWGIPLEKGKSYRLVVWAKGSGDLSAGFDRASKLGKLKPDWARYETTLKAGQTDPKGALTIQLDKGEGWIGYASLMPTETWKGRKNGLRTDLAKSVEQMKPAFVRFPGGCFVEGGDRLADRFEWKKTLGPVEQRQGIARSMWGYPTTSGLGYHEYLQWCEDLGAEAMFVVNVGMSHRERVPMEEMQAYVQDTLDAIEYAVGPVTSKWGAERAKAGHPKPFNLKYVEIGNENGGPVYNERFKLFSEAIGTKYPQIVRIANLWGGLPTSAPYELIDEHYYNSPGWFWQNMNRYDSYKRTGPKIYVGEYAVTQGSGDGNLAAALGEAAFMTGMERNSDVVALSSYAPLFVNVNNRQWNPNAIVFDAARSFGTPSYHVQAMFGNHRPDRIVAHTVSDVPVGPPPAIAGTVGLMTWKTQAEFKDIEVVADGKPVFTKSQLASGDVRVRGGEWSAEDGAFRQTDLGENRKAIIQGIDLKGVQKYTLSLKARKIAGDEGFIILLDDVDPQGNLQYNFGGWSNRYSALQRNGAVVSPEAPVTIETGRWYDIRIERDGGTTRAFLDGKLVQEFTETGHRDFAAVAGVDDKRKELILKVVNGANEARTVNLDLSGVALRDTGRVWTLTGPDLMAENSFDNPNRMVPKETKLGSVAPSFNYSFAPRSVTVIRVPIR